MWRTYSAGVSERGYLCGECSTYSAGVSERGYLCGEHSMYSAGVSERGHRVENTLCAVGEYQLCQTTINKESSESFSLLLLPVELHSNFRS